MDAERAERIRLRTKNQQFDPTKKKYVIKTVEQQNEEERKKTQEYLRKKRQELNDRMNHLETLVDDMADTNQEFVDTFIKYEE